MTEGGTVTVLFTDWVESTPTFAELSRDEADEVRRRHFAVLRSALSAHRGTEVKSTGDGLMATFASASGALAAAIRMQQATARLNGESRHTLGLRVGLSAGDATAEDGDWYGAPVVEASRLCAAAPGSAILVADIVRLLAGRSAGFQFGPEQDVELKGFAEPITARVLEWDRRPVDGAVPFPPALMLGARRGPFVGRAEEQAQLLKTWDAVKTERRPHAVAVAGEPGIGKTRLVAETARHLHGQGVTVLFGRCQEGFGIPYLPLVEALAALPDTAGVPSPLQATTTGRRGGGEQALSGEGEAERFVLFRDTTACLLAVGPAVLVIDDVHWADQATLLLLRHLLQARAEGALLVVMTYRDTELGRTHPLATTLADLRRDRLVERVPVTGLAGDEVDALVKAWSHERDIDAPDDLASHVFAETEGNPFFVEEMLAHLDEAGTATGLPEGVREVVGRRLSRLSDEANEFLRIASVVGRDFDLSIIEKVGRDTAKLDAVEEAVAAGLLVESPDRAGSFSFSHALIRQTLFEELSLTRRVRLHWEVGKALLDGGAAVTEAAQHLIAGAVAGDPGDAATVCLQAAEVAMERLAFEDVVSFTTAGRSLLDDAGRVETRLRGRLWLLEGDAYVALGQAGRGSTYMLLAGNAAKEAGDVDTLVDAAYRYGFFLRTAFDRAVVELCEDALQAIPEARLAERSRLHSIAGTHRSFFGEWITGADDARRAEELAVAAGDARALFHAHVAGMFASTEPRQLRRHRDAVAAIDVGGPLTSGDGVLVHGWSGIYHFAKANRDALARELAALDELAQTGFVPALWFGRLLLGAIARAEGRFVDAKAAVAEIRGSISERADGGMTLAVTAQLLSVYFDEGRMDRVIAGLEPIFQLDEPPPVATAWKPMLAAAFFESGDIDRAALMFDEFAARGFDTYLNGWSQGVAARFLAELGLVLGDTRAMATLDQSLREFSGELLVVANGIECAGATDRVLAQTAHAEGDINRADAYYAAAANLEDSSGFGVLSARTRYWHARLLAEADRARAVQLARASASAAERLGMRLLHEQAQSLLVALTAA